MASKTRRDILFQAKAEMIVIRGDCVRFRVGANQHEEKSPLGVININSFTHIDVPRDHFPRDPDFSLDFINDDLDARAKMDEKDDPKAVAALKKKQAEFKKLTEMDIIVVRKA